MTTPIVVSYTTFSFMATTLAEIGSIGSSLTSGVAALHASGAQNEINAKIAHRYVLPFTTDIPLLTTLCTAMAIYKILTGRIIIQEEDTWVERCSKDPPMLLDSIAEGKTRLLTSSFDLVDMRTDAAAGGAAFSNNMKYDPTHTELPWTQHIQDPDKIDDLESERDLD